MIMLANPLNDSNAEAEIFSPPAELHFLCLADCRDRYDRLWEWGRRPPGIYRFG